MPHHTHPLARMGRTPPPLPTFPPPTTRPVGELRALDGHLVLWNGHGWTPCWLQFGSPSPVSKRATGPKFYRREKDARAIMSKAARGGNIMVAGDLRDRLLRVAELSDGRFCMARVPCL